MTKPTIDGVWQRIRAHEGEQFRTKTGQPFTYEIVDDIFRPSRTIYDIRKPEFQKALEHVPFDGPGVISQFVRGPSYVWAVLHDRRVRQQDW